MHCLYNVGKSIKISIPKNKSGFKLVNTLCSGGPVVRYKVDALSSALGCEEVEGEWPHNVCRKSKWQHDCTLTSTYDVMYRGDAFEMSP
jgi:hypothetical protein